MQIVDIMEKTFQAESGDVALYLAMSQKAADEGHSDIAEGNKEAFQYFEKSMHDEIKHKAGLKVILSKLQEKD
jgi:rubrerythrin